MERRYELNDALKKVLGSNNVYFQPSENIKLNYDCIIYKKGKAKKFRANNNIYINKDFYELLVISKKPDNHIVDELEKSFKYCEHQTSYTANGLYHSVVNLFY